MKSPIATALALALLALLVFPVGCGGGGGGGGKNGSSSDDSPTEPPVDLVYDVEDVLYRSGAEIDDNRPTSGGGRIESYAVSPDLPAGLVLDADSGVISGTPTTAGAAADYTVTGTNGLGSTQAVLRIGVDTALPAAVRSLEPGFAIEAFAEGLDAPVKMAFAPDGRLFFNELTSGRIRVLAADGTLNPTPFATLDIRTGSERGLIGLALAPDFATSGHVFVFASVTEGGRDRNRVVRFTAVGDLGTAPLVIVDDLPIGRVHNSGDLRFGPDGKLYVSVGDTGDSDLAQMDGEAAGRIHRYEPDGTIPADNPDPSSPEWCRGIRNTFDLTFHPVTGGLFATENGPTEQDEINFIQRDRNFEWETLPPGFPGSRIGVRITDWTPVIAPTGLVFYVGAAFGAAYVDNLFVCGYVDADLRRLVLSGPARTDLDDELPFASWDDSGGVQNKPLDIVVGPDDALYVSTFSAIWRIRRS